MTTIHTKAHKRLVKRLIEARQRSGLRQIDAAKKMQRSQTWIARIESGDRRIDVCEFGDLTRIYKISPYKLIDEIARLVRL